MPGSWKDNGWRPASEGLRLFPAVRHPSIETRLWALINPHDYSATINLDKAGSRHVNLTHHLLVVDWGALARVGNDDWRFLKAIATSAIIASRLAPGRQQWSPPRSLRTPRHPEPRPVLRSQPGAHEPDGVACGERADAACGRDCNPYVYKAFVQCEVEIGLLLRGNDRNQGRALVQRMN